MDYTLGLRGAATSVMIVIEWGKNQQVDESAVQEVKRHEKSSS